MKYLFSFSIFMSMAITACTQQASKMVNSKTAVQEIGDYIDNKVYSNYEIATFAGGCFWCTEASFENIKGVKDVISGYSGGDEKYPSYGDVCDRKTGHAESVQIYFDPKVVSYQQLLEVFFVAHDPTTLNRQGPDSGPQYRSAIFYHNEQQKKQAEAIIEKLNHSGHFANNIVTEVTPYKSFWVAEGYHQDYYRHHPNNPYIRQVSKPKVEKVRKIFKDIMN